MAAAPEAKRVFEGVGAVESSGIQRFSKSAPTLRRRAVASGLVFEPQDFKHSSARQYLVGEESGILNVEILDFGVEEGYVFM